MTAKAIKYDDLITGVWKFSSAVTHGALVEIGLRMRDCDPGYRQVYIRDNGNGKALGFSYQLSGTDTQKRLVHRVSDQLRRQFGNDLVGWDISSPTIIIEGGASDLLLDQNQS